MQIIQYLLKDIKWKYLYVLTQFFNLKICPFPSSALVILVYKLLLYSFFDNQIIHKNPGSLFSTLGLCIDIAIIRQLD